MDPTLIAELLKAGGFGGVALAIAWAYRSATGDALKLRVDAFEASQIEQQARIDRLVADLERKTASSSLLLERVAVLEAAVRHVLNTHHIADDTAEKAIDEATRLILETALTT